MLDPTEGSGIWRDVLPGVRQRVLVRSPEAILLLYEMEPGRYFPSHIHPLAQMGLILEGGGKHTMEGSVRRTRAGDSYYIPPSVVHDFRTDNGEKTLLIDCVVPQILGGASASLRPAHLLDAARPLVPLPRRTRAHGAAHAPASMGG